MADPRAAARRVHAALVDGARFATSVWGAPDSVPFLALPRRALTREFDLPPVDTEEPGPFRLQHPEQLRAVLTDCGFVDVAIEEVDVVFRFQGTEEFAAFISELSSSTRELFAAATPAKRKAALAAIENEVADRVDRDGALVLTNTTLCAVGRRP